MTQHHPLTPSSERRGKLIVFDGNDGSGKATQVRRIIERLEKEGHNVRTIDFPRYYDNFFGRFIGECLTGQHGDFIKANPRVVSVLYSADRKESDAQIRAWLSAGDIVIADRYVSANQIHQGGKLADENERAEFMEWLDTMEHSAMGLVRPDMVMYLDVPYEVSLKNLKNKQEDYSDDRIDVHETNVEFLKNSRECAVWLADNYDNWQKVDCMDGEDMRSIDDIHEEVYKVISELVD